MQRCVILLQARMDSSRLPGKVLSPVLGKPLLAYEIERLQHVSTADDVMVVTSDEASDDPIADWCMLNRVPFYRGSLLDVLDRYYQAARQTRADIIVRVTGDCPLIDPDIVNAVIHAFQESAHQTSSGTSVDYVSNTLERTFPRGLDVEVFTFDALETAWKEAKDQAEREHVTPYIYNHQQQFRLKQYRQAVNHSHHRWTVDVAEDFELIEKILSHLHPENSNFRQADVLDALKEHPSWFSINSNIEQKTI